MRFKYNFFYRIFVAILSLACIQVVHAANCNATLTVTKDKDLSFGDYEGSSGGIITISSDGTRSTTGGIVLLGGTTTAATYVISNSNTSRRCKRKRINITVPAGISISSGSTTMAVNNFVTSEKNNRFRLKGGKTVTIGADLVTNNNQSAGSYSGVFSVDFSY